MMAYSRGGYKKKASFRSYQKKAPKIILPTIARGDRVWSAKQLAIFAFIDQCNDNAVILARAGTGKTTTLEEVVRRAHDKNPSLKIGVVAFSNDIKTEVAGRLYDLVEKGVEVSTCHSLGYRFCRAAFRCGRPDAFKIIRIIQSIIGPEPEKEDYAQRLKDCISKVKLTCADTTSEAIDAVIDDFGIDMGKGATASDRAEFISVVQKALVTCRKQTGIIDFDDMLDIALMHKVVSPIFDLIVIDETQDLNRAQLRVILAALKLGGRVIAVGDDRQCVEENTPVNTPSGYVPANKLKDGDKIISNRNGDVTTQTVSKVWPSAEKEGITITTKTGKQLTMSDNHLIWATDLVLPDNKWIVYLMYRNDLGFRIGKTNKTKSSNNCYGASTVSERAEKLWIMDVVNSNEEALLVEVSYSLEFGIPTCVFNGEHRGLNQNRINSIFKRFGLNGTKLLETKKMSFDHPHYLCSSMNKGNSNRLVLSMWAHSAKGTRLSAEWSDTDISNQLDAVKINYTSAQSSVNNFDRNRVRKSFNSYRDALMFAQKFQAATGALLSRKLSNPTDEENPLRLLPASALFCGQEVVILDGDDMITDEIVDIQKVAGKKFIDIEVTDASNFFAGDILSHNCIYKFMGADERSIPTIIEALNAKTLTLSITYRCAKAIVKLANEVVPDLEAAPDAVEGLVENVTLETALPSVRPGDFVLSRTNAPLIKICMSLLKQGIPANIQGGDLSNGLLWTIKKSQTRTVVDLVRYVEDWRSSEVNRLVAKNRDHSWVDEKADCIIAFCTGADSINDVKDNIKRMFNDADDLGRVTLSSTHKAKGLERDRVFMLADTYKRGKNNEEDNLWYVAVTRARKELYMVEGLP